MINFPIFLEFTNGTINSYKSYDEIEEKIEYFLLKDEQCEVYDSKGQKIILNVFLNEVKDLYPEK